MYGTVARLRVKPGCEAALIARLGEVEGRIPGAKQVQVFRLDADHNAYFMVVAFESKEAYVANAESAAQRDRYEQLLAVLDDEPEWHDGEIIYVGA